MSADATLPNSAADRSGATDAGDASASGHVFKALVALESQQLAVNDLVLPLAAGMQVSAEIIQGRRTVLEYLLCPVQRAASEAATER